MSKKSSISTSLRNIAVGHGQGCMPVISATWEAETGISQIPNQKFSKTLSQNTKELGLYSSVLSGSTPVPSGEEREGEGRRGKEKRERENYQ